MIAFDGFDFRIGPAERGGAVGEAFLNSITFAMVLDLAGTALTDVDDGQSWLMLRFDFFRHAYSPFALLDRALVGMFAVEAIVPAAVRVHLAGPVAVLLATLPRWATRLERARVAAAAVCDSWLPP